MTRIAVLFLSLFGTATVFAAPGDELPTQKIIQVGKAEPQSMELLNVLVNQIGARLTGSHNNTLACEWAVGKFKEWGLTNVRMEEAGSFDVAFNRGPWSGRMTAPKDMELEFGTPAWSAGTAGAVMAQALRAPKDAAQLEKAKAADFKGKWVLVPPRSRRRSRDQQAFGRDRTAFLNEAGIAGLISSSGSDVYIRTNGNSNTKWDALPTTPRINLRKDQYDEIGELIDKGEGVELRFDIRNHFEKGPAVYYNVLADIAGTDKADEFVVIGGHIDSWDGATGTTDNGTGAAVAMEAARILAASGVRPRRTIRFMLWSGEEQGLLGSRAYVQKHPDEIDKISAVFVFDGGPNAIAGIDSTQEMLPLLKQAFAPVMDLNPEYPFEIHAGERLTGGGSDHSSFLAKKIPGFFWDQKGRVDARHGRHTQFDTFDQAVPEYLNHSSIVVALAGYGVAQLDRMLPRDNVGGRPRRGAFANRRFMGVTLDGLLVQDVVEDSVAAGCKIQAGDLFFAVDGKAVSDRQGLVGAIHQGKPDKKVTMVRDGKKFDVHMVWKDLLKKWKEDQKKKKKGIDL